MVGEKKEDKEEEGDGEVSGYEAHEEEGVGCLSTHRSSIFILSSLSSLCV